MSLVEPWQGPEVPVTELGMLLGAGEVEAEDTLCSERSFKLCHFW